MKRNTKALAGFLTLAILIGLAGCKKEEIRDYPVLADPSPADITQTVPMDFEMETDYSNISVKTEKDTYSKDT